jgi:hypothetical protein
MNDHLLLRRQPMLRNNGRPMTTNGWRLLVKSAGRTLVAVTAWALGIGVNATLFTLANAVLSSRTVLKY